MGEGNTKRILHVVRGDKHPSDEMTQLIKFGSISFFIRMSRRPTVLCISMHYINLVYIASKSDICRCGCLDSVRYFFPCLVNAVDETCSQAVRPISLGSLTER